jgi:NodT family efflux transporter outer membrane factor (OMF) lipoprotein
MSVERGSSGFLRHVVFGERRFVSDERRIVAGNRRIVAGHRRVVVACLALSLLLSGCTSLRQWWHNGFKVGPNYCPPGAPVADEWLELGDPRVKREPAQDCLWWTNFNDPTLNGLVESAYRQNLDLRVAATRILEARAQRNIAIGNLFPQSQSAMSTYVHGQISQNLGLPIPSPLNVFADGFNASWEIDFWGRYRRQIESSNASLAASLESYGDTLVMLLSDVATNYVQMRTFEQRLEYARRNVRIQQGSLKLAEDRFQAGKATELDARQARSNLAQTESLIPPLITGRRQAANRLCILLGMPVTDLAEQLGAAPIPTAPVDIAVGIPADLLRRRPDIRRAAFQVAAQSAQIGVAEADLYPRLALNGFIGYAASDFKDLFNSKSFIGFIIPSLQWNILNYGRIASNIRVQDARLQGAAIQYQQTVLTAGREVEDALINFLQTQQQAAYLERSVEEADQAVELVVLQFKGGVTDFNRVFNTQSTLVTLQDQLAATRGNIALSMIQVYRAMGGGWQHFAAGRGMPQATSVEQALPAENAAEVLPPGGAVEEKADEK